ncbi:hypothetical protein QTI24_11395 [Variovorax sp. J22P240]|uniref:hypothetical protein n=1 Tax=unclassified Variovorax TaxID=663243 RepID=UPI0025784645|nr:MULTISPECIES: hypothetical protein [unclassified Variovorax]MDL9999210.1 hypothetical protein [Variovorax sp. J22P240]MDM0052777.1 hypothetical protein [Variovorax sp. J22R115]
MNPIRFWGPVAALAIFGALAPAHALTNPPIQTAQGIEYMCGGKSSEEAAFMQTVSPRWAATLEFGVSRAKPGNFPSDVKVSVRERYTGRPIMEASTGAPFMLARLEPGAYEVEASMGGVTLRQPLVVFNGMASKAVFVWPSNVDFAATMGLPRPEQQASVQTGD